MALQLVFNLKNLLDDVRQVMIEEENDEQKEKTLNAQMIEEQIKICENKLQIA
ncbi:MAG: hypothetical protein IPN88_09000 [Bacteroidetes bacterium]|nr:hypothetical protein [Bacteroidota bacterium]